MLPFEFSLNSIEQQSMCCYAYVLTMDFLCTEKSFFLKKNMMIIRRFEVWLIIAHTAIG